MMHWLEYTGVGAPGARHGMVWWKAGKSREVFCVVLFLQGEMVPSPALAIWTLSVFPERS